MIPTRITTIIFDFGGVLLDWNPHNLYRRFFNNTIEIDQFLSEINFYEWNLQQDRGRSFARGIAELSGEFPQYSHLIHAYGENWAESIAGPINGSVTLLRGLKDAGYFIYGLSNWSAETFPIAYNKYEFFKLFEDIIISGEVKIVKPDPAIFKLMVDKIGHTPQECLLIDDTSANTAVAQQLGFATIQFQSPEQLGVELQKLGLIRLPYLENNLK